ncbi:MAG: hypothetical protein IT340_01360 [Chloroflexi bacterium]|nr:hypothetical protein [Chloroflexota bacterium]
MSSRVSSRSVLPTAAWRAQLRLTAVWPIVIFVVVGLAAMSLYLYRQLTIAGTIHPPLDDAWIHFRFAENLARGLGMSFNPGVATPGTTSPFWVLLLAAAWWLTGEFPVTAKVLGGAAYLAALGGVYALSLHIRPARGLALLVAVFAALNGRFIWASLSGMETTLFAALTIWGIVLHLRYRDAGGWQQVLPTVVLAVAAITRPEALALIGLTLLDRLLVLDSRPAGASAGVDVTTDEPRPRGLHLTFHRARLGAVGLQVLIVAAFVTPMLLFNYLTAGSLLPNTFAGQSLSQGGSTPSMASWLPDFDYLREVGTSFLRDNFLLICFVPIGVVAVVAAQWSDRPGARRSLLPLAWVLGLPLLDAFIAPNLRHHERYLMPLLPLVALLAVHGMALVAALVPSQHLALGAGGRRLLRVGVLPLLVAITLVVGLREVHSWSIQYARDVRSIDETNVAVGRWLREHTPPDAVVATHDIGAVIFFSDRTVIDTVGLVEPGILPYIKRAGTAGVEEYVRARMPRYFVSWPHWYPGITDDPRLCRPVYTARATMRNWRSLLPADTMVIYECVWPNR